MDRRSTGSNTSSSSASSKSRPAAPCWDLGYHSIEGYEPVYQADRLRGRPLARSPASRPAPDHHSPPADPVTGPLSERRHKFIQDMVAQEPDEATGLAAPLPRMRSRRRWAVSDPFPEDAANLHEILPRLRRQQQAGVLPDEEPAEPSAPPPAPAPSPATSFVIGGGVSPCRVQQMMAGPSSLQVEAAHLDARQRSPASCAPSPASSSCTPVPHPRTRRAATASPAPTRSRDAGLHSTPPAPSPTPSPAPSPASCPANSPASTTPPVQLRSKSQTPEVKKKSVRLSKVFSSAVHLRSPKEDLSASVRRKQEKEEKKEEKKREKEEKREEKEREREEKEREDKEKGSMSRERGRRLVKQLQRSLFGGSLTARSRSASRLTSRAAHHGSCDLLAPTKAQVSTYP